MEDGLIARNPCAAKAVRAPAVEHERIVPWTSDRVQRSSLPTPIGGGRCRVWKPTLRAAGVEPTRANGMHALRHFYASVQLEAGTSIRAVAEYLGHADPGFTLRVYTHPMP